MGEADHVPVAWPDPGANREGEADGRGNDDVLVAEAHAADLVATQSWLARRARVHFAANCTTPQPERASALVALMRLWRRATRK